MLFARWISDFDCGYETEWYHVIKDEPFEISSIKAKRRYEINKGNKNFYTKEINPVDYKNEILFIIKESYKEYPKKYRPIINDLFIDNIIEYWSAPDKKVIGVFKRTHEELRGVACLELTEDYINYLTHKVVPADEKKAINAALVYGVLRFYESNKRYKYITDGERAIKHQTNFHSYLEKYFGFRKAYCKLNILYNPIVKIIVSVLYPFRGIVKHMHDNRFAYNIYCVLGQECIRRSFK